VHKAIKFWILLTQQIPFEDELLILAAERWPYDDVL